MSTFKKTVAMGFFVGVLAVAVAAVTLAQQRGGRGRPMPGQTQDRPGAQQMRQRCQQHMERRRQMLEEIQAMEQRLQSRVDALNAAEDPEARMDALVLLVNELADQRIEMFQKIQQMHEDDLRHIGECPMMDGAIDDQDDTSQ